MNQNINQAKMKERMQTKLQQKQTVSKPDINCLPLDKSIEELYESIFSTGEFVEKTPKDNKKKNKKGKNKK